QTLFGGCNLNRPISSLVERGGFEIERLENDHLKGAPKFAGFLYRGVARSLTGTTIGGGVSYFYFIVHRRNGIMHRASWAIAIGIVFSTIALAFSTIAAAQSQSGQDVTPPRSPWGDPDLQGIWPGTSMVGVPLQRPQQFG